MRPLAPLACALLVACALLLASSAPARADDEAPARAALRRTARSDVTWSVGDQGAPAQMILDRPGDVAAVVSAATVEWTPSVHVPPAGQGVELSFVATDGSQI